MSLVENRLAKMNEEEATFSIEPTYLGAYYENLLDKGMRFASGLTRDKRGKYYLYGACQCLLLDRFAPGWKRGLLEENRSLDELTAGLLSLTQAEKQTVASRLRTKYSYDDLYSRHEAALGIGP